MKRRSARGQSLPRSEAEFLSTLTSTSLYIRVAQLYNAGWTYKSIGDALNPPRPRSTIKSWVDRIAETTENPPTYSKTAVPVDFPRLRTPEGGYQRKTPKSPGVSPEDAETLSRLAKLARGYRHGMGPNHPAALANEEFDKLLSDLHSKNVSAADLSRAAGITHRAISRRLKKQ